MTYAGLFLLAAALGCAFTYVVWWIAEARALHAAPNDRSMHARKLAVGAGWAIVTTTCLLWSSVSAAPFAIRASVLTSLLILAVVSWIDDLRGLPPPLRLLVHAVLVAIILVQLPADVLVFGGLLPQGLDRLASGLGWLWFINLYNFMDGIDGITGTESLCVCLGYVAVVIVSGQFPSHASLAVIVGGACLGFLVWNWHPARIILGDTGSIPLGFTIGWLMLDLATRGYLAAALILPLYHVCDASFTLARRIIVEQKPWQPHRQHGYQRAVLGGLRPPQVVGRIGLLNVLLIGLAMLSVRYPWPALVMALAATAGLLFLLTRRSDGEAVRIT